MNDVVLLLTLVVHYLYLPIEMTHAKLIDDVTVGEAIPMEKVLTQQPEEHWVRPLPRRSRYELAVPEECNKTSEELVKVAAYAEVNYMQINKKKTKVILFNPRRRTLDFQPEVRLGSETLEVVNQLRLVGLEIADDLTWHRNTQSLVRRAFSKVWILRRLRALGASRKSMLLIYYRHIRSILEFGVPAWNGALTIKEGLKLERVQKVALRLIFGFGLSYRKILEKNNLERLADRRERLCLNFAKKATKHVKFKGWFKQSSGTIGKASYCETVARRKKLLKSPIPYLTRLLNKNNM